MNDDDGINQARQKELASVPPLYRGIYVRAYAGGSRSAAVHAFCLRCTGDKRDEVRRCSCYACPLWEHRPYRNDVPEAEANDVDEGDLPNDQHDKVQP